jgi:tRNA(Ile)-lysidine synthase
LADSIAKAATEGLLPREAPVLVACSGGADSVALAAAVAEAGLRLVIGHVDHGLRKESACEAEQVRALAEKLGAPFFLERLEGLDVRGQGLEAAARLGRYAALARLAHQASAPVVATAHTRRDQAETLLLRLLRGAGPGALAGVRRRRPLAPGVDLVRPILDVPRAATEAHCRARGLAYTDDPHNSDPARTRARLRRLWPALVELNPRLEEALAGAAESLAEEDDLLAALLPQDLRLETLQALPPALLRRAILKAAVQAGVHPERAHFTALRALIGKGRGALDLPGGRAEVHDGGLRFLEPEARRPSPEAGLPGASPPAASPSEVAVPGPGHYAWHSRELTVAAGVGEDHTVDLELAPFPWTLRGQRPGDRFRPAGGRTKKVADLWIDARIPRADRSGLAVLCDAEGRPFWVEGLREGEASRGSPARAAGFRIRPEMKPRDGRLTSMGRPESGSATMDPRSVQQPEGGGAVIDSKEPR